MYCEIGKRKKGDLSAPETVTWYCTVLYVERRQTECVPPPSMLAATCRKDKKKSLHKKIKKFTLWSLAYRVEAATILSPVDAHTRSVCTITHHIFVPVCSSHLSHRSPSTQLDRRPPFLIPPIPSLNHGAFRKSIRPTTARP